MTLRNVGSVALFSLVFFAAASVALAQTSTTSTTTVGTAPSGTSLGVTLNATPRIAVGTPDALLALVTLQAGTGNAVQMSTLPVDLSFSGDALASHLSDCRARNVTNVAAPLNSSVPTVVSGANTIIFTGPLTIDAGRAVTLAVTCDIAASAPVGGAVTLALTPSSLPTTVAGSSTTVTPVVGQGVNGGTGPTSGTVSISAATAPPVIPLVPGVPNTGAGDPLNLILLVISAAFALGGVAFLARRLV